MRVGGEGLAGQSAATVGATAVGKACIFALHVLLARQLGAAGYGAFVVAYTLAGLLVKAATFGTPMVVMRGIARARATGDVGTSRQVALGGLKSVTGTSVSVALLVVALSAPLAGLFFTDAGSWVLIALAGTSLPMFAFFGLSQGILHGAQRIVTKQVLRDVGRPIILLALTWIALKTVRSPESALLAYNVTGVIILVLGGVAAREAIRAGVRSEVAAGTREGGDVPRSVSSMLSASYPFLLAGLMYQAATYTDRLMLGALASEASVGHYGAAAMIAQQVSGVSVAAVAFVVTPVLAGLAVDEARRDKLRSVYQTATKWMITIGLVIAVLAFLLRTPLLTLYGSEFAGASGILTVLLIGHLVFVTVGPSGEMLQMGGWEKLDLKNTTGMVVVNVLLNVVLIPSFGAMGAAIATAASIAAINVVQMLELRQLYDLRPLVGLPSRPRIGLVLMVLAGLGAGVGGSRVHVGWTMIGTLACIGVLIYLMVMTEDERNVARSTLNRFGSTLFDRG